MRRLLKALAVAAVLLAGVVTAIVIHRLQAEHDVQGSSTEFVTTVENTEPLPKNVAWPEYGFEPNRTRAVDLALRPPYRRVWTFKAGSLVEFPPAIAYGRLYFSTNSGKLLAVNAKTGKRAWKYLSHRCVAASPAVGTQQHGTIYAVFLNRPPCNRKQAKDGKVIAFAAGHGNVRWQKTIGPSESSPLLAGNRLYTGDWGGRVWALDARSGRTIWRSKQLGPIKGAPALAGGKLYAGSYDGHLYCFGAQKGRLLWRAKAQSRLYGHARFYSSPAVAYGRVYIGGTDGKVYSFGATSGKLRWSHSTGGYVYASPAVWNQLVLVGSYSKKFYAFNAATGAEVWHFKANGPISGSATVVGNVVYFATLKERTYALNARTGKLLWSFPDGKYTPVVAEKGRLYLIGYARIYGMVPK
ncbi:MAG TPA: PQQ-binding-like beta-propeller repeat protein [Gaiellaceae bacterium]